MAEVARRFTNEVLGTDTITGHSIQDGKLYIHLERAVSFDDEWDLIETPEMRLDYNSTTHRGTHVRLEDGCCILEVPSASYIEDTESKGEIRALIQKYRDDPDRSNIAYRLEELLNKPGYFLKSQPCTVTDAIPLRDARFIARFTIYVQPA